MKVKVGESLYDSKDEPVMVILDDVDKEVIAGMAPNQHRYCTGPNKMSEREIDDFMDVSEAATPDNHVDRFIESYKGDAYARFCFLLFRLPATLQVAFRPWIRGYRLFCNWKGERYRVTGASRLGDVWLAEDFSRDTGYDHRVMISECSEWGSSPSGP